MIDVRSDTVTLPSAEMMTAMFNAKVGDDVFGEDPSVNKLEQYAANLFEMEAALFCASGTMSNQIAIKVHTQPGDEIICHHLSHIYQYEGGGIAFNSGCSVKLLNGNYGIVSASDVEEAINPSDIHKAQSRLVCLENTTNRGGGACYTIEQIAAIQQVCEQHQLLLHLDGARLFNALVANGETPAAYGKLFNSISICLSKSLGAPVGSILLGSTTFIAKARRIRKIFGGGMRQAGYLAAAGLYALQHNVERLTTDHHHAQLIASALLNSKFVQKLLPVTTNIVIFEVAEPFSAKEIVEAFKKNNIYVMQMTKNEIRFVLHLNISIQMVETIIQTIKSI